MLSPEERAGMLDEAADPRRREAMRAARAASRAAVPAAAVLEFLTGAGALFARRQAAPRPRPRPGGWYLL